MSYTLLTDVEYGVYGSNSPVRESFYYNGRKALKIGDILCYDKDGWRVRGYILDEEEEFIGMGAKRKSISTTLNTAALGPEVVVSLESGVSFTNNSGQVLKLDDGTLKIEARFTESDAFNIYCKGQWKSLEEKEKEKLFKEFTGLDEELLGTIIRDRNTTYSIVTEIFTTTSEFNIFTTTGESADFVVEISSPNSKDGYKELSNHFKTKCPGSTFENLPAPIVPFFRASAIVPLWKDDEGNLKDTPPVRKEKATRNTAAAPPLQRSADSARSTPVKPKDPPQKSGRKG